MSLPLSEKTAPFFGVRPTEKLVCMSDFLIWVIKRFLKLILLFSTADLTRFRLSFRWKRFFFNVPSPILTDSVRARGSRLNPGSKPNLSCFHKTFFL